MTSNEQELESIASASKFEVPNFATMRETLDGMSKAINALLTNSTGWKGETAAAGKAQLADMMAVYGKVGELTLKIEAAVGKANGAVDVAIDRLHGLPASAVPSSVLNAVGTSVHFMGMDFPINGAVGKIASLLAAQREQVARDALDELERNLDRHRAELRDTTAQLSALMPDQHGTGAPPIEVPQPAPTGPTGGPGGPGTGGSGPSYRPWTPSSGLEGPGGRAPSIDDPLTSGTIPGTGTGTPPWTGYPNPGTGTVPTPGIGGGGGIVPGLGGAAGAAGLAAAARLGMGAGGGAGGAAAGAGAGAAGAASGSSAAGAGGRGGASVMGGGGAGGGAPEKEKRSGLGGLIAPKLEDDEEIGPRSAAADAGGRDS